MDPHTGEIIATPLALHNDPNIYTRSQTVGLFSDSLVEGRYELGSIMKPLTNGGGIDSGAITGCDDL